MLLPTLLLAFLLGSASAQELGLIHMRLEGMREKCLVEDLPANTVCLGTPSHPFCIPHLIAFVVKHTASTWDTVRNEQVSNPNLQLLVTVRDPKGHTVTRQQSKPDGRVFLTAATTGEHQICFQALMNQFQPNTVIKLPVEVFIGDAGDPHITSPVEAKLNDLSYSISRSNELVADIEREQALHRDREQSFRDRIDSLHSTTVRWPIIQALVLVGTAVWQMDHLKKFFKAKKLV